VDLEDGRRARLVFTDGAVGDLRVDLDPAVLDERRAAIAPGRWTWMRQAHGPEVVVVDGPGAGAGRAADAAVTVIAGAPIAVHTADCAPIALVAPTGGVGVVHAGWRGLEAGVVAGAVRALRSVVGDERVDATLGPCIHPECYEFGAVDLDRVAGRFGPDVRARTATGRPALDLPLAVARALAELDVRLDTSASTCTGCDPRWWSHRARGDRSRQALVAWIDDAEVGR